MGALPRALALGVAGHLIREHEAKPLRQPINEAVVYMLAIHTWLILNGDTVLLIKLFVLCFVAGRVHFFNRYS